MKKPKEYTGQYLVTNNGQRLVILTRIGAKSPGHCYYMTPDFKSVNAHQKKGFECLNPDIEWKWALDSWGRKPQVMSSSEVDSALMAIKNLKNRIAGQKIEVNSASKPQATQSFSGNQSLVALKASMVSGS
jgi:hypothetical protein